MGGNIPGRNFPGENFPGGSLMGGNFPGGNFPRTVAFLYPLKTSENLRFSAGIEKLHRAVMG